MRALFLPAAVAVTLAWPAPARAQSANLASLDKEVTELVKKLAPSVVRVGAGNTGVCVSPKGLILTDISVARRKAGGTAPASEAPDKPDKDGKGEKGGAGASDPLMIEIAFSDQKTYKATVLATDEPTATAILRIDAKRTFPSVRPGNPSDLAAGHLLMTIGNSFGSAAQSPPSVTLGVLAGIRRDPQGNAILLETTTATNPGQEGGPYFNMYGDLIGLEKSLPSGDDLATLTPIDRIVASYPAGRGSDAIFERPRVVSPPTSLCETLSQAFAIAAKRGRTGVVTLVVERPDSSTKPDPVNGIPVRTAPVSGTVIDPSGLVVAAAPPFLVEPTSIDAYGQDGARYPAAVMARDFKAGLVLLSLDLKGKSLAPLPSLPAAELQLGQFCVAVGSPDHPISVDANDAFVTTGILSATHQLDAYRDALQTDAGVGVKNAGGALVDLRGRLIGVLLPPSAPFGQNSGLGFAMPIEAVMKMLPRWRAGGTFEPAVMGAQLSDAQGGGVRIDVLTPKLPAEQAGLKPGDVVTYADGVRLGDRQAFTDFMMASKCAGDPLTLTIVRGKETLSITLTLAKRS